MTEMNEPSDWQVTAALVAWEGQPTRVDAMRAALRAAGVVAEEPEWEYGQSEVLTDGTVAFGHPVETLEEAIRRRDIDRINYPWPEELGVGRRRMAGSWESITQEGEPS